jgi:hypothetical protein
MSILEGLEVSLAFLMALISLGLAQGSFVPVMLLGAQKWVKPLSSSSTICTLVYMKNRYQMVSESSPAFPAPMGFTHGKALGKAY